MIRVVTACMFLLLFLLALWQLGQAGLLAAKAWAAPILIERAWDRQLAEGGDQKPWPWADSFPVARLSVPDKGVTRYVLEGDNMRNLAFGPVLQPEEAGPLIYGHRDTHFRFLQDLSASDTLTFQLKDREETRWKVASRAIVAADELYISKSTSDTRLHLITCYPFDSFDPDTDERLVVTLTRI